MAQISRATDQDKVPVAIATIDRAALVNLQPDFGMAKGRGHICTAAVTGDAVGADKDGFWRVDHLVRLANASCARNDLLH